MEKVVLLLLKMMVSIVFVGFVSIFMHMLDLLILKPRRIRSILKKQGIKGPSSSFLLGNIGDMKAKTKVSDAPQDQEQAIVHNYSSKLFTIFEQWTKEYGSIFTFSLGNVQILHPNHPDLVKEINTCTSLNFGKPFYQQEQYAPLFGQGILTSNGAIWAHQRKILAPEFHLEKVKGMMNLMVEFSTKLVDALSDKIEKEGGMADIKIDDYLTNFSRGVMSRVCLGSNYAHGDEIFQNIRALEELMTKITFPIKIPGIRYLPTKNNREAWRLEKEIQELILNVVKSRKEGKQEKDILQIIIDAAQDNDLGQDAINRFIVGNCKNIFLAGFETTAVSLAWTLMLLASNLEWQAKVRAEIFEACRGQLPDADMIRKMKLLNMVIHESLRLYSPIFLMSREALQDMKLGDIHLPKGVIVRTLSIALHQDPEIWGEDVHKFNPERFASGVRGACKNPQVYMPFGFGPRICLGQSFAMAELKIVLSMIVSNFSFSLSPKYRHSPTRRLVIAPEYGVDLLITKL